jgi:hypothetical protein
MAKSSLRQQTAALAPNRRFLSKKIRMASIVLCHKEASGIERNMFGMVECLEIIIPQKV